MSHLLPCKLYLRSRVGTLPAIKDVETKTILRNRTPIGRRNSLRAMQPLLRHDSHRPMPRQLHRSGRPATITGQHRASPSPGRQHRNGRKHRLRTATQALDMPQFQCRNPSRLRRTRRARASQRTTNTRQLIIRLFQQSTKCCAKTGSAPLRAAVGESRVDERSGHDDEVGRGGRSGRSRCLHRIPERELPGG